MIVADLLDLSDTADEVCGAEKVGTCFAINRRNSTTELSMNKHVSGYKNIRNKNFSPIESTAAEAVNPPASKKPVDPAVRAIIEMAMQEGLSSAHLRRQSGALLKIA